MVTTASPAGRHDGQQGGRRRPARPGDGGRGRPGLARYWRTSPGRPPLPGDGWHHILYPGPGRGLGGAARARIGATIASIAPGLGTAVARRAGGGQVASAIADGHRARGVR